jgi:tol-pal system protein YbgF
MVGAIVILHSGSALAQAPVYNLNNDELASKVANLERVVNSRTRNQQRVQEQITELQTELSEIRGRIEEQNFQIEKILQRQRELLLAFDIQSQQLQEQADRDVGTNTSVNRPVSVAATAPVPATTTPVVTQQPVAQQGEEAAYQAAVNLILRDRNTQAAIPKLEDFAQTYPDSRFKPNAHYWLGQIFYNERQWPKAQEHFGYLINNYPDSNKAADATMKLGIIEKNLGNNAKARSYLNQVLEKYPGSTSEKMAREQLNLL